MKLKELISGIYIYLTSDKQRLKFMFELQEILENNKELEDFFKTKSNGETKYLEDLFTFWKNKGDLNKKLMFDIEKEKFL